MAELRRHPASWPANDHTQDAPLPRHGGGGTSGGMSDDWKESVERRLGELHGDVRALLNRGVIAVVALAGMIGAEYLYINNKFDGVDEKFDKVSERLTAVERKVDAMDARLDAKLDALLERNAARKK